MKTIILLGLVVLVLSMVMTAWAQNPEDPEDPPVVTEDPPAVLSGSSDDVKVDVFGDNVRVKRAACVWWFIWRVRGSPRLTGPQINASIQRFFATVVCR